MVPRSVAHVTTGAVARVCASVTADEISIPPPRPKRKPSRACSNKAGPAANNDAEAVNEDSGNATVGAGGEDGGATSQRSVAAVTLAASVAAAAAASAVVVAAGEDVRNYLQVRWNPRKAWKIPSAERKKRAKRSS